MNAVFGDTSYYVAILTPSDSHHAAAWEIGRNRLRMVVTEFVLLELADFMAGAIGRRRMPEFIASLRADPDTKIIPLSTALLDAGLDLYNRRPDKIWSLTDCISFVVMKQEGLTEALTADRHFHQAGFKALLRHAPPARE